jgi:MFS family permease
MTGTKPGWSSTFTALKTRNYRWLLAGTMGSFFAQFMLASTQAWLAFQLTHSPLLLGLVSAAQGVPQFAFNLFSGVIIDRMQKRNMIMYTQAATIVNTLIVAILITTGYIQYWHLLVSAFISGSINAFNFPARNSIIAELVPKDKVYNAYALNHGGLNAARIAAPALAGLLIGLVGTQGSYYAGTVFNLMAIITISFISPVQKTGLSSNTSFKDNFKQGFQYLKAQNIILILLGMELALTLFGVSYQGLIPVFADMLNVSPQGYGFMLSAIGIGALIGSMLTASLGNFKRKGMLLITSGFVFGLTLMIFGNSGLVGRWLNLGTNIYYLAAFWLTLVGFSSVAYTTTSLTIIQMFVNDEYRGRVTSFYQMVTALSVVSFALSGALAQAFGAPMALTILGGCLAIFMLNVGIFSQRVRKLD